MDKTIKIKGITKDNINKTLYIPAILKLYNYGKNKKTGWYSGEVYTTSDKESLYIYQTKTEIIIDFRG